jgi:hypothetical protein
MNDEEEVDELVKVLWKDVFFDFNTPRFQLGGIVTSNRLFKVALPRLCTP